ncbi:carboxylesterase family protein [Corynebacterium alimapuense]|uniref:Carboxylic ester hydrolase n=1 Tax=Corynebacterium alimapuense TaxID=1576874 RepID=A0A3M8K8Y5_9CORY|nr:carboxylesterase family protein [Corynebacterium alimapuense]RNE49596.1 carboxylesterase [Corynebacterium alimapuense]
MSDDARVTVYCPAGEITGTSDGQVTNFRSIPYSHIPGDFFDAQRLPNTPQEPIDATVHRPESIALSITTPHDSRPLADLPVIVYIHGGRFENGTHGDRRADGAPNARAKVITVHIGYRVKLAGFAQFHNDEPHRYRGIDDCQLGLEWVQRNIESFGGDPTNVTLVGQSAGATTALWLSRRDHYRGCFRRVMAMSPCFPRDSFQHRKGSLRTVLGKPVTRASLTKLAAKNPRLLERGYSRFRTWHGLDMALGPTPLDGAEMTDLPLWMTSTREEFYHLPGGRTLDDRGWGPRAARFLAKRMGLSGSVSAWIAAAQKMDPERVVGRLIGDASNRRWVSQAAEQSLGPVWMSEYVRDATPALHCVEIPYVFGLEPGISHEQLLRFAHGREPLWPRYTANTGRQVCRTNLDSGTTEIVSDPLKMVREAFGPN